ncbi:MAG: hypothetical protein Q9220_006630 [cf. Caloplaca sp. 1 TL-2023]
MTSGEPSPPSTALRLYFANRKQHVWKRFEDLTGDDRNYWLRKASADRKRYLKEKMKYNATLNLDEEIHTDEEAEADTDCGNGVAALRVSLERKRCEQQWSRYRQDHHHFNKSVSPSGESTGPGTFPRFVHLPPEIRHLIYSFALRASSNTRELRQWNLEYEGPHIGPELRLTHLKPLDTRVLAANRQIYQEALNVLFSSNCFAVDVNQASNLPAFVAQATGCLAPRPTSKIRRWHVKITFTNIHQEPSLLYQLRLLRDEMSRSVCLDEVRFTWISVPQHWSCLPALTHAYDSMLAMFGDLRGVKEVTYTTSLPEQEVRRSHQFLDGWDEVGLASEKVRRAVKTSMETPR